MAEINVDRQNEILERGYQDGTEPCYLWLPLAERRMLHGESAAIVARLDVDRFANSQWSKEGVYEATADGKVRAPSKRFNQTEDNNKYKQANNNIKDNKERIILLQPVSVCTYFRSEDWQS